jgi:hypothetical protein
MNNGIGIKIGIIVSFFILVLGLAYGCSSIKSNDKTPQLQNGDDVFLTVGDINITNQDLWNKMKISDGLTYLDKYVDEILLADYLPQVTQDMIDEKVEQSIYGSNDADAIAKIKSDPTQEDEMILAYERSLLLQGLDPNDADDVRSFFELSIAKELYARDFVKNITDSNNALFIDESVVKDYYDQNTKGDVCALTLRFQSYNEAQEVFDLFNVVPNFEGGLGLYFGTTPIKDVPTANFDDTNTKVMTDDEALAVYIDMYNYLYPNNTQLDNTTTLADFCATYGDDFTFNYEDMTQKYNSTSDQSSLASYLWNNLQIVSDDQNDSSPSRFSIDSYTVGEFEVMAYKVNENTVPAYDDLTQDEKDALYDKVLDSKVTSDTITQAMADLRSQFDFEIFDPTLKLQYAYKNKVDFDNNGDDFVIARFDGKDITAQELFDYMMSQIGSFFTLDLVKQQAMLHSTYYTDVYGDDYDYLNNSSDKMVDHRTQLRSMKTAFSSNAYEQYGFSSKDYTWEEFIVLAFNDYTETDVIRDVFVMGSLQPYMVKDMISYENAADFIQAQVDEYFSLNVTHLLLYRDDDMTFTPDEYNDYVNGLTGTDQDDYNQLVANFESLVKSKINNDDYSLEDIVNEYRDSLVGDNTNEWAEFKAAGFYIMTEDLSAASDANSGPKSLTNANTTNYDEDFVAALKRIYDAYVVADQNSTLDQYIDDRVVQSNFGLHFIIATKGDGFDQPSALFDATGTDYDPGFTNDSMVPSKSQVELYNQIKFAEQVKEDSPYEIPSSVQDALDAYYGDVFNDYFTSSGYAIASAQYMLDNNVQYSKDQADEVEYLQNIINILYEVNFPKEFITPAEMAAQN